MALTACGFDDEADAAYGWLVDNQLPDGSWFNYYLGGGIKDPRLDTNVCAYLATGAWHRYVSTGDVDALAAVSRPSPPGSTSSCAGSGRTVRSTGRSTRPGSWRTMPSSPGRPRSTTACVAPSPAPSAWTRAGPTGSSPPAAWPTPWPTILRPSSPRRSSPWTGTTRSSRGHSPARRLGRASMPLGPVRHGGRSVRCVSTGEWVTAAKMAECVLPRRHRHGRRGADPAHLGPGAAQRRRLLDGHGLPRGGDLPAPRALHLHRRGHGPGRRRTEPDHGGLGHLPGRGTATPLDLTEPAPGAPVEPAFPLRGSWGSDLRRAGPGGSVRADPSWRRRSARGRVLWSNTPTTSNQAAVIM